MSAKVHGVFDRNKRRDDVRLRNHNALWYQRLRKGLRFIASHHGNLFPGLKIEKICYCHDGPQASISCVSLFIITASVSRLTWTFARDKSLSYPHIFSAVST